MLWLEPMIEVVTPEGRIAYGPGHARPTSTACSTPAWPRAASTRCVSASPEKIPYLARQHRLTFQRCGVVDPVSVDDYRAHGGYKGLEAALKLDAAGIVGPGSRVGPAWPWWRGLPGRHQVEHGDAGAGRRRNTWSATPTRAIPEPSPTA